MEHARHAHQFDDAEQQHFAATLAMWTFLATEILFFGGLFAAYTIYRIRFPEVFAEGSHHLVMWIGAVNTAVLLLSSFTMAMAVHSVGERLRGRTVMYLGLTALLGIVFLGFKALEYSIDFQEHLVPGLSFAPEGSLGSPILQTFFFIYFVMTGIHAVHLIIGIVAVAAVAVSLLRLRDPGAFHNVVEMTGLYWHLVDLIWVFLFPLLYLLE